MAEMFDRRPLWQQGQERQPMSREDYELLQEHSGPRPQKKWREGLTLSEHLEQLPTENAHILDALSPQDRYAQAVNNSLDRPVISIESASAMLGIGAEELSSRHASGFLSPRQYMEERGIGSLADDVGGFLAGTLRTNNPEISGIADEVRSVVQSNAPEGEFAKLGGRPQKEQESLEAKHGSDARFFLTPEGERSHDALRVAELWRATDENYLPASGMAQAMRAIGGVTAPIYNLVTGRGNKNIGQPWDEMATVASPGGKFRYAVDMYDRASPDKNRFPSGHASVFAPDGRPRYTKFDGVEGFGQFTSRNQDFPMAAAKQYLTQRVGDWGNTIGNAMVGADANYWQNADEIRQSHNRTVPRVPEGMTANDVKEIGGGLRQADDEKTGWFSAYVGPLLSDAYNSTAGRLTNSPAPRTYLSGAANTAISLPIEMLTDVDNLAINFGLGPIAGGAFRAAKTAAAAPLKSAATSGAKHMIRSLVKAPSKTLDDIGGEMAEDVPQQAALDGNVSSYFEPERHNMLTGGIDPDREDYWKEFQKADIGSRERAFDATTRWGKLRGR